MHTSPADNDGEDEKSKSQLKREMTALQELGETLVALSSHELERIPLPEKLHDAIMAARAITQRSARKRQLQYIGKVMRDVDAQPIRERLADLQSRSRQSASRQHHLEHLRDRLLEAGDDALGEVLQLFPDADRTRLRQLTREAQHEMRLNKPPHASRALFRYLRELQETNTEQPL